MPRCWRQACRGWRDARAKVALGALALATASGCVLGAGGSSGPQVVDVLMREYRFSYRPPASSGRVVFRVRNEGKLQHELMFLPLPELDVYPRINAQLHGKVRRRLARLGGIPAIPPGDRDSFAVDLQPGRRYALVCFLVTKGRSHALAGMNSEFRSGQPANPGYPVAPTPMPVVEQ